MYYIYHIPGKKIGVTRNLKTRVTLIQGYKENEYEVLEQSDDISYVSDREIELQKSYGYKVDRQTYENLINSNKINKMEVNVTEQTTTFPVPLNKLKDRLEDAIGLTWETCFGEFTVTKENFRDLFKNCHTSMYNNNRSFVYNKILEALAEVEESQKKIEKQETTNVYDDIRQWATDKGIYAKGDYKTQYIKLMEESGELAEALLKNDETEVIDAIGDMVVVLTNLAKLRGLKIEDCVASAYSVIANRKGKMINGTFVKQENIKKPFGHQSTTL